MSSPRFLLTLLLAAACTPAQQALTDADRDAVTGQVRDANVALVDALNAHDVPTVLDFYESGPQFEYVGCTQIIPTSDVFRSIVAGYHRARPDVTWEMAVTRLEVLDRNAAVAMLQGESDSLKLFTTRIWRRNADGAWKIAYEHESWPGCKPPALPHPGTIPGDTLLLEPPPEGN